MKRKQWIFLILAVIGMNQFSACSKCSGNKQMEGASEPTDQTTIEEAPPSEETGDTAAPAEGEHDDHDHE